MPIDTHKKTVVKTISYRSLSLFVLVATVWFFTGEPLLSLSIGVVDILLKLVLYYVHERIWTKIHF